MLDMQMLNIYRGCQRELVTYAVSIVGENDRAEDIVQDAYLKFSGAMAEELRENPVGYLYRIVRNLALDHCRRVQFEKDLFAHSMDDSLSADVPEDKPTLEQQVDVERKLKRLQLAFEELPERTRIAVEMHRLGGYKLRDIAFHLDISTSMAQYLVKEGIKHCQYRLSHFLP
jgi:RNA polymerase sigma factor (sigma-70 family)